MKKISWTTEKRKLSDLLPWEQNPRQLSEKQAEDLKESLSRFGLVDPPAINTDNTIIGGHQRSKVLGLMKEFGNDAEIDVRVPSRRLTGREVEELNIRLNKNTGSFDFDALANNFNVDDLLNWGFNPFELGLPAENIDFDEVWQGMPEYQEEGGSASDRSIIVHFRNPEDVQIFSEVTEQPITEKTRSIWFPYKEKANNKQYSIIDES